MIAACAGAVAGCSALLGIDDLPPVGDAGPDGSTLGRSDDGSLPGHGDDGSLPGHGDDGAMPGRGDDGDLTGIDVVTTGSDATPHTGACSICDPNAACLQAGSNVTCTCNFGWTGNGNTCVNDGPTCAGPAGSCVPFTPSGGATAADLDGNGLLPFTGALDVAPPDGGVPDGSVPDGGDAGFPPGETIVEVDTGLITHAGVVVRPATTGDTGNRDVQAGIAYRQTTTNVAVFTFRSLTVPQGATLRLVGARAVILASATTMRIDGVIDVRPMSTDGATICAPGNTSGTPAIAPGGFVGGGPGYFAEGSHGSTTRSNGSAGAGPGGGGGGVSTAGAGGGHGGAGGAGCTSTTTGTCATQGSVYDGVALDGTSFQGGSGGGGGDDLGPPIGSGGGWGGSGGGAVRLIAVDSVEIGGGTVQGGVNASGCGGQAPDPAFPSGDSAGGGGGAGGAIVVEAPRVQLDANAALTASGGGGASYGYSGVAPGLGQGVAFGCYPYPSPQGPPSMDGVGAGASTLAGYAGNSPDCSGGGGVGRIRINAGNANAVIDSHASLSPTIATGIATVGAIALVDASP